MRRTLLPLLASLAVAFLTSHADGAPLKIMSAPNLLRVGVPENVFVECLDCTDGDIKVDISVWSHPTRAKRLASTSVMLTRASSHQMFGKITIPPGDFNKDPNVKQYVYLQAQFGDQMLEKVVLLSFQSGHIFIQTDKTLYTPNSRVLFRMFAVTPQMEPVDRDEETRAEASIVIEIVTPDGIVLSIDQVLLTDGVYSGDYHLPEIVSPGLWKVVARFQNNPRQSYTADFEVKEHVLPSFEVKVTPRTAFFYVDSPDLVVDIRATYLFGEWVDGTAYVVFGVVQDGQKRSLPNSLQRVPIQNGEGQATLSRHHITHTFPNIMELVGSSIFASVGVLTESGSEMAEAEMRGINIVTSPFTIHFKNTAKYFKRGMTMDVMVEVLNPDESPAAGVHVVVNPGDVHGMTSQNGLLRLPINTLPSDQPMIITAKTNQQDILPERQASATMTASPYTTTTGNYIHIAVDTAEQMLHDYLRMTLYLNRQPSEDITFLIMSRGQLVKHERVRTEGRMLISKIIPITKDMLPSFRIIAYYHPNDNEVVSDSVWVDVKDSCMGSLKLEPIRATHYYEPRRMFGLKVTGDPGAVVGLVAVDKGVYVLNNKHRLTQKKIWDAVEKYDTGCTPGGGKDSMGVFYDAGLVFETDTASGTPYRQEHECPALQASRRKRASTLDTQSDEDDDSYVENSGIFTRTNFPESWLWTDIHLPPCPPQTPHCETTHFVKNVPLQDSITTWQFTGISLSRTHGICVGEPLEVIVRKEFFIDLRLPYSAVRGEQLEIKAILHNYSPDIITVRVDLTEQRDVCSAASKRGRFRQEVKVGGQTTRSVPFTIIPMKEGRFSIEVKAAVKDSSLSDGIMKMLRVVPEGVLVKAPQIITLDPVNKANDGDKQRVVLNSNISTNDLVPNSPTRTFISVTGTADFLTLVESVLSGTSMGSLIYRPSGNGEANMIHMTLPVIATMYLDRTNQWEAVGFQKRAEALNHIRTGYNNQLAYRGKYGSFSVWASHPSSTWLTAYVAKVFAMAHDLVAVEKNLICEAVKYLILNAQQPDGMFREVGRIVQGEMTGDVRGADSDASMTAFSLIAMQESRALCADTVIVLSNSIDKAVGYLETRLPRLTNSYAVAMTSYALANENKLNKEILYRFVSPELSHWPVPKGQKYTLEATAYALLALVKAKAFEDARPVVRWFNQQQFVGGGYGSTQSTIMVYQAISEYWAAAKEPEYNLDVDIKLPGRTRPVIFNVNRENHHITRSLKINDINQDIVVVARGTGEATVKMVSLYYALPKEKESDCQKFNMSVELIPDLTSEHQTVYKLRIEVFYKDRDHDSTMTILEIGLLRGFTVNVEDLDLLARGHAHTIAKYEMNTVLSERGSLIIYLDKVSHTTPKEISFRIHRELMVAVLQPAAVSVYEYYDEARCVKFYHPEKKAGQLLPCAAGSCSMQELDQISNDRRTAKICGSTQTNPIDFAYKVRLESFEEGVSRNTYTMRILNVLKKGRTDVGVMGSVRIFHSHLHCKEVLGLQTDKTYLVMGSSNDIHMDDQSYTFQYVLDERTWIEYWPTAEECQSDDHRPTCLGLEEMVDHHDIFGCQCDTL